MSDEEDQPEPFLIGFGLTDAMRREYDQRVMVREGLIRKINSIFREMVPEDLATFRLIFHHIASVPEEQSQNLASYYEGLAAGVLLQKDLCPGCGADHADDFLQNCTAGGDE